MFVIKLTMAPPLDSGPTLGFLPSLPSCRFQILTIQSSNITLKSPSSLSKNLGILLLDTLFSDNTYREIQKIPFANHNFHHILDKIKWLHHSSGIFSVKSAYAAIVSEINSSTPNAHSINWKGLWKLKLQDRLKLLFWKISHNILPTKTLINTVIPLKEDHLLCPLCKSEPEDLSHLFLNCFYSKILWRHSNWPRDTSLFGNQHFSNWIKNIINPSEILKIPKVEHQSFQNFSIIAMDNLWYIRNKLEHN